MTTNAPDFIVERPRGVLFQKIQFGNERGGRSVLFDSPRVHRSQWGNLRLSRQIATSEVQFLIKDERFVQKRPSDLSRSRSLLSSAPLFVEFHPGGEYCRDVEGRGISQADSHPAPLAVAQNVEPRYPTRPKRHPKQLSLGFPYRPWT